MREIPRAIEAEKAVLGIVLVDPESVATVLEKVSVRDFYDLSNKTVMKAIVELGKRGKPCDVVSVGAELERMQLLDGAVNRLYLTKLMDAVVTTSSLDHYLEIVKEKSVLRQLIRAGKKITELGFDEITDAGELLDRAAKIISAPQNDLGGGDVVAFADAIQAYLDRFVDGKFIGQSCGYASLDYHLFDIREQAVIIAGLPHMGKTVFALNMLYRLARKGVPVGVISLEMTDNAISERLIQMAAHVSRRDLLTDEKKRLSSIKKAATLPIFYGNVADHNLSNVMRTLRHMVREYHVEVVLIDYLQLVTVPHSERHDLEIGKTVEACMHFAKDHQMSILLPSQVNRKAMTEGSTSDRGKPQLWFLKDSDGISAHSDIILGVWRPSYINERSLKAQEPFEVSILKNRGGLVGDRFNFTFYPLEQRIEEDLRGNDDSIF